MYKGENYKKKFSLHCFVITLRNVLIGLDCQESLFGKLIELMCTAKKIGGSLFIAIVQQFQLTEAVFNGF